MKFFKLSITLFVVSFFNLLTAVSEFYFIRHGQTDFNIGLEKQYWNMPMNLVGVKQVESWKNKIKTLPIEEIYFSPLKRTTQTKDIIQSFMHLPAYKISEFKEAQEGVFYELQNIKKNKKYLSSKKLENFLNRVKLGLSIVLADTKIPLIVAHGGVYAAICYILDVQTNLLTLDKAMLVHFYKNSDTWKVDIVQK